MSSYDPTDLRAQQGPVTQAQLKLIHASFTRLGLGGNALREQRLATVSRIVGRTVTTTSDLTKQEASRVIDALIGGAVALLVVGLLLKTRSVLAGFTAVEGESVKMGASPGRPAQCAASISRSASGMAILRRPARVLVRPITRIRPPSSRSRTSRAASSLQRVPR